MSDRPRRSARNSSYNSPSHTPGPTPGGVGGSSTPSRLGPQLGQPAPTPTPHHPSQSLPVPHAGGAGPVMGPGVPYPQQGYAPYPQLHPQHFALPHPQPQLMPMPAASHLPDEWFLARGSAPILPFTPLAPPQPAQFPAPPSQVVRPIPQALYSTFPSRMRTGVTTLMQPMQQNDLYDPLGRPLDPLATPMHESRGDYGTPSAAANLYRSSNRASKRRAAAGYIRYAEADDSGEDFEDDLAAADDDDGARGTKRKHGDSAAPDDAEDEDEEIGFGMLLGLPPPGNRTLARRMYRPSAHLYHPDEELQKQAARNEVLVPIRIELETETHRIKDTFTWNMNEKLVTPHHFARLLLEDLDLPLEPYATQISNMISQQVEEAIGVADIEMEPAAGGIWSAARLEAKDGELALSEAEKAEYDPAEEAVKESRQWDWGLSRVDSEQKEWRLRMQKRLKTGKGLGTFEDDIRVIVDYEVQILRHSLRDRLEWDLCSPLTPESFATQLCKDLGLSGEALPIISNSVREQLINHKRAALELGLLGTGRLLKAKEAEIAMDKEEAKREQMEHMRRRLEGTGTRSETPRSEAGDDVVDSPADRLTEEPPTMTNTPPAAPVAVAAAGEDESEAEEVETLHLTAPATAAGTAVPTREPSTTPAPTRSSSRIAAAAGGTPAADGDDETGTEARKILASERVHLAEALVRDVLGKSAKRLEGVWRDFMESREFGPLLERLTDEDLQKVEEAHIRSSRRNRREAQRGIVSTARHRRR